MTILWENQILSNIISYNNILIDTSYKCQYYVRDSPRYITPPTNSHFSDCLVTMGKGTLVGFLFYSNKCIAMTKSLRVAAKAVESSAARWCAAAAGSQHQPATSVANSRGASPREDVDPELVVN